MLINEVKFSGESNLIGYRATMRDEHSKIAANFTRVRRKRRLILKDIFKRILF